MDVSDERSTSRDDLPVDLLHWGRTAGRAALAEGVEGEAELGLCFLDEEDMAELAAMHLGAPGSTDVLAFPLDFAENPPVGRHSAALEEAPASPAPSGTLPPALIGDVVVCPAVAARQAAPARRSLTEEMTLLVVHGVLHLLGYDHAAPGEAALMKERTEALLQELNP